MANDLPAVAVTCEKCHTSEPHKTNWKSLGYTQDQIMTLEKNPLE
jgi:hypothetical protein